MSKRKKKQDSNSTLDSPGHINAPVLLAYYATLAIGLVTSLFPAGRTWGFSVWSYLPLPAVVAALAAAVLAPFLVRRFVSRDAPSVEPIWLAFGVVVIGSFFLLRSTTFFLGDGRSLISQLADQYAPFFKERSIASVWLNNAVFKVLGAGSQTTARHAFQLTSSVLGAAYLGILLWAAARLFRFRLEQFAFFALMCSGGYMLNYFGYVELYALFNVSTLLVLVVGWLATNGQVSRWWFVPVLILTASSHIFYVAFIPAIGYSILRTTAAGRFIGRLPAKSKIGLFILAAVVSSGGIVAVLDSSYFIQFALVPVFSGRFAFDGYTMFSTAHLLDILNQVVILVPGAAVLMAAVWVMRGCIRFRDPAATYLFLAAAGGLLVTFLFDPKLGMPRDWDLFSFVGQPLVMLAGMLMLTSNAAAWRRTAVCLLAAVVGLLWLSPRAISQATDAIAIKRLNDYIELDRSKNRVAMHLLYDYYVEHDMPAEASLVENQIRREYPEEELYLRGEEMLNRGQLHQAIAVFDSVIAVNPHIGAAWANKGNAQLRLRQIDSARANIEIAVGLNPGNVDFQMSLAYVSLATGETDRAEELLQKALRTKPDLLPAYLSLAGLYMNQNRLGDAEEVITGALRLPDSTGRTNVIAATIAMRQADYAGAVGLLQSGLARGLDSATVQSMLANSRPLQEQWPSWHYPDDSSTAPSVQQGTIDR